MRLVLLSVIAVLFAAPAAYAQPNISVQEIPPGSRVFPGQIVVAPVQIPPNSTPEEARARLQAEITRAQQASAICSVRTVQNAAMRNIEEQNVLFRACLQDLTQGTLLVVSPGSPPCVGSSEVPNMALCVIFTLPSFVPPAAPPTESTTAPPPVAPTQPAEPPAPIPARQGPGSRGPAVVALAPAAP